MNKVRKLGFDEAIDDALAQAMAADPRVMVIGEDVQMIRHNLLVRFGRERIKSAPISESAFVGAGVTAAMAGLRPVVEVMIVDFIGVAMDALLNHAAKIKSFSGGKWNVPMVVRAACGGGYGDGGQHEQSLWGWLAHIPGLTVVVPSTPADAGRLMLAAIESKDPVIFLEHKLLSATWLDFMGRGGRSTVAFDVPSAGMMGDCPKKWQPLKIGKAVCRREGDDLTLVSVGVGVHRCLEAAQALAKQSISAGVLDLRSVAPLDKEALCQQISKTRRLIVVDEDYQGFGLSGEVAAVALEAGLKFAFTRVCTEQTIPYARHLEDRMLPNTQRICKAGITLMQN